MYKYSAEAVRSTWSKFNTNKNVIVQSIVTLVPALGPNIFTF